MWGEEVCCVNRCSEFGILVLNNYFFPQFHNFRAFNLTLEAINLTLPLPK